MNIRNLIIVIITTFLTISCENNESDESNNDTEVTINNFKIGTVTHETPNCYIEFDEQTDNNASFNLFFLNGKMYDNDGDVNSSSGDYLFSLNTTNFVFYNIRAFENPSIETPQYPNIETGVPYIGSDNDTVITHDFNVPPLPTNFNHNGVDFGMPDENTGIFYQPLPNSNINTITINSYNFDSTTQTGTINVDYTFTAQDGTLITGHYEGNLGVIID